VIHCINSFTALHAVVSGSDLAESDVADIIQMLYDTGGAALLAATTSAGQTALHLAVAWPARVQQLCALCADVEASTDSWQTTPLRAVSDEGDTPLRASLKACNSAAASIALLIDAGSDVLDITATTR
jgi:hypothetical protein